MRTLHALAILVLLGACSTRPPSARPAPPPSLAVPAPAHSEGAEAPAAPSRAPPSGVDPESRRGFEARIETLLATGRFEEAATLLESEYQTGFRRIPLNIQGITPRWANDSQLWIGGVWLYDRRLGRVVAAVSPHTKPYPVARKVFAVSNDWVLAERELWNVAENRKVAEIAGDAAAASASGSELYVLDGDQLLKYSPETGVQTAVLGRLPRASYEKQAPALLGVTPKEHYATADGAAVKIYDVGKQQVSEDDSAFSGVALADDWIALANPSGIELRQGASKQRLTYRWRKPPHGGDTFEVSRDRTHFMIGEPAALETLVFRVPDPSARTLRPLLTVRHDDGSEMRPMGFSADGAILLAKCDEHARKLCLLETASARQLETIAVPPPVPDGVCQIGIRIYPGDVCRSRTRLEH